MDTVIVLGVLASTGFISANYVLSRKWSIFLLIAASTVLVIQYGPVMDLWGLALLNFVFILRNISFNMSKFDNKHNILFWVWLIVSYSVYIPVTFINGGFYFLTIIPLFSILFNTLALAQKTLLGLKVFLTLNSLSWMVFDIVGGLWGNFIGDAFGVAAGTVAVIRILNRKADSSLHG